MAQGTIKLSATEAANIIHAALGQNGFKIDHVNFIGDDGVSMMDFHVEAMYELPAISVRAVPEDGEDDTETGKLMRQIYPQGMPRIEMPSVVSDLPVDT